MVRSSESRLHIANITYEHQGEYFCRATNVINGNEKKKLSDGITLQVVGKCRATNLNKKVSDCITLQVVGKCRATNVKKILSDGITLQIVGKCQATNVKKKLSDVI